MKPSSTLQKIKRCRFAGLWPESLERMFYQAAAAFIFATTAYLLVFMHGLQTGGLLFLGLLIVAWATLYLCQWAHEVPKPIVLCAVIASLVPAVLFVRLIN